MPDLHLFDDHGTLAIIDTRSQIAWLEPTRTRPKPITVLNMSLRPLQISPKCLARSNIIYRTGYGTCFGIHLEFQRLAPEENEYYKIEYWPQPAKVQIEKLHCIFQPALYKELNFPKLPHN